LLFDPTSRGGHTTWNSLRTLFLQFCPTPAARPPGRTLSSLGGPCLSAASWAALLGFASVHSDVTGSGVNGFGSFCRNKRSSAGPNPGISRTCSSFPVSVMEPYTGHVPRTIRKFSGISIDRQTGNTGLVPLAPLRDYGNVEEGEPRCERPEK